MNTITRLMPGRGNPYAVGFDSIFQEMERLTAAGNSVGYPPYNLLKNGKEEYTIEMALAGFNNAEINVTVEGRRLTVSGNPTEQSGSNSTILHRGIARRAFTREFILAQHVEVSDAVLADGILKINLKELVPESARPRRIEVGNAVSATLNEQPVLAAA